MNPPTKWMTGTILKNVSPLSPPDGHYLLPDLTPLLAGGERARARESQENGHRTSWKKLIVFFRNMGRGREGGSLDENKDSRFFHTPPPARARAGVQE